MNHTDFKGEFLIVLNKDEDTIALVDVQTNKVIKTIDSDHNPHEIAITPDEQSPDGLAYLKC